MNIRPLFAAALFVAMAFATSPSPLAIGADVHRSCADIGFPVIETKCPYRLHRICAPGEGDLVQDELCNDGPSENDATCKGWVCRIELPTPGAGGEGYEQHWTDSDGVRPEVAGCHQQWRGRTCEDRQFLDGYLAEQCVGDLLIETNPGKGVCHPHELATRGEFKGQFVGHPDVYSCPKFCLETGQGRGRCVAVKDVRCADGTLIESARCDCTGGDEGPER